MKQITRNTKLSVSIGIPAHNEENNIAKILKAILLQKRNNFLLKEILVVCDGCTDHTAEVVRSLSKENNLIKLVDDGERKGKSARINQILSMHQGEIVICSDADICFFNDVTLVNLVKCFISDPDLCLVGATAVPRLPKKYFESIVYVWINCWREIALSMKSNHNLFNINGAMYALNKRFSKNVDIPADVSADDVYVFCKAVESNCKVKRCTSSVVTYIPPTNLNDFVKQSTRFAVSGSDVTKYFGEWAKDSKVLPKDRKLKVYLEYLRKYPIRFSIALFLQLIIKINRRFFSHPVTGVYETIKSTK